MFQEIYEPYKVIVSVDKTKEGLFIVDMNYNLDNPHQTDSIDKNYKESDFRKALGNLRKEMQFGSSKLKKLMTAKKEPLSKCVVDLCDKIEKTYPWVQKIKSYPPRKVPAKETGNLVTYRSLLINFPLRMPAFNYLYSIGLFNPMPGSDSQKVTYYLNLTEKKAEGCIEIAPGINGTSVWDGDFLRISATPNIFIPRFKETVREYLQEMNDRNLALFDPERDEKSLERFIIDAFSEFYSGKAMPFLI